MKVASKQTQRKAGANGRQHQRVRGAATTEMILGSFRGRSRLDPSTMRVPRKWQKQFRQLVSIRERLLEELRHRANEGAEPLHMRGLHPADVAADDFDQTFRLSLLSAKQELLYEVEEALRRIGNDTYGICELTGKRISPKRLEAVPWARFSEEAEAELEKQGVVSKARLGEIALTPATEETVTTASGNGEEESAPTLDKLEEE